MTNAARVNSLALEGNEVKLKLEADRRGSSSLIHVDWLRFTCQLRNAPFPSVDRLFPIWKEGWRGSIWDAEYRRRELQHQLMQIPDVDFLPASQAADLAEKVAAILGDGYTVTPEIRKGHDFYKSRISIERGSVECGWVGFGASSESPRQSKQAGTLHVNLYGSACTFAPRGWREKIADLIDELDAKITRADLALDLFDGLPGGFDTLQSQYDAGAFNVGGKRPKVDIAGDWFNGRERSLYIGSKGAGKQTNVYEKGDQLFGREANNPWARIELRYGNKLRVLPSDLLRRPDDFFAGASDWHQLQITQAGALVSAQACPQEKKLAEKTVEAEVSKNVRWFINTAMPTVATLWNNGFDFLGDLLETHLATSNKPGRLRRFSESEITKAYSQAKSSFSTMVSQVSNASPTFGTALQAG